MKKITIIMLLFAVLALSGCTQQISVDAEKNNSGQSASKSTAQSAKTTNDYPMSSAEMVADKLEVYYFHRTARCYSCRTMGELVTNLINQRYSQQVKEGKIDFRQLNVELPENKEIARKFRASGSSLFINRIIDGQDKIEQDANVWRYLSSEANFNKYLGAKIDSYLGL